MRGGSRWFLNLKSRMDLFCSLFRSLKRGAATFVTTRMGGSCTQGGKPEEQRNRQTRRSPTHSRHDTGLQAKNARIVLGALLHFALPGYHTRSLHLQRRPESIPSKKSATRHQSAQAHDSEFAYKVCGRHPILRHLKVNETKRGEEFDRSREISR